MQAARALNVVALVLGGCAQTDLVARVVDAAVDTGSSDSDAGRDAALDGAPIPDASCEGGACSSEPLCPATSCFSLNTQTSFCAATTSPVRSGDGCSGTNPSAPAFLYALCSCSDVTAAGTLTIDAFASTISSPAPAGAALGVNGNLTLSQAASVDGNVHVAGTVAGQGSLKVDRVSAPPCACNVERQLDVSRTVAARKLDNDNASIGLAESALDNAVGNPVLDLPCGRYFFTRIASARPVTIQTHGNVALFVEGNIELDDSLQIQAQDSGQVSLFVAGELRVGGAFSLGGDPNGAGRASLYAGGQGTLAFRGSAAIVGNLVAPNAELVNEGILELYGSALVRRAAPIGDVVIHYDTSAATPSACPR